MTVKQTFKTIKGFDHLQLLKVFFTNDYLTVIPSNCFCIYLVVSSCVMFGARQFSAHAAVTFILLDVRKK